MLIQQRIDYRRAVLAPFEDAQWAMTLLWVTLAMLVPLVGPIVGFGYQSTLIEAIAREGVGARLPVFDLERAADYLLRGVRMFVVSLLVTVIVTPIAFVVVFAGNVVAVLLFSRQEVLASLLAFLLIAIAGLVFLVVIVLGLALVTPLWVRAALESDLGRVFDLGFVRDFLRRVGRETLAAHLFAMVVNLGLLLVGFLACFIGMFPAIAIGVLVQAHLFGQLYLLYLSRGGTAIVLPPPAASSPGPSPP